MWRRVDLVWTDVSVLYSHRCENLKSYNSSQVNIWDILPPERNQYKSKYIVGLVMNTDGVKAVLRVS
jgi:hypothetical protein